LRGITSSAMPTDLYGSASVPSIMLTLRCWGVRACQQPPPGGRRLWSRVARRYRVVQVALDLVECLDAAQDVVQALGSLRSMMRVQNSSRRP
jgi:hypothetical protein